MPSVYVAAAPRGYLDAGLSIPPPLLPMLFGTFGSCLFSFIVVALVIVVVAVVVVVVSFYRSFSLSHSFLSRRE